MSEWDFLLPGMKVSTSAGNRSWGLLLYLSQAIASKVTKSKHHHVANRVCSCKAEVN